MGGRNKKNGFSSKKLNKGLLKIVKILHKNNLTDWFIAYGTLLGIVRDNSCIEKDDDIDIICNKKDRKKIINCLENNGFKIDFSYTNNSYKMRKDTKPSSFDREGILKTSTLDDCPTIDFYCSEVDDMGNYKDNWETVTWSNCYVNDKKEFIKKEWNGTILHLPNNFEEKLKNRYGESWKKPMKGKTCYNPKYNPGYVRKKVL